MNVFTPLLISSCLLAAGCTSLPSQGPATQQIKSIDLAEEGNSLGISLVTITAANIDRIGHISPNRIDQFLKSSKAPEVVTAQSGDHILVRIWEANPDGIFSTTESPAAPIETTVSMQGEIYVPFAGAIYVKDRTPTQVRQAIQEALDGKAINPQVQVDFTKSSMSYASVTGGVQKPGPYVVAGNNTEILELISATGGSKFSAYETDVAIMRGSSTYNIMLSDIFAEPKNNIVIHPGDVIEMTKYPRTFTAFGSVPRKGLWEFPSEKLTLEQAIAKTGGLIDTLSDASGVFVFRFEGDGMLPKPFIYNLDMSTPDAFFLARKFEVSDNDILYVSNAPAREYQKFITTIVNPAIGSTRAIQSITQ